MKIRPTSRRAFSLVELLVVVAIITLLGGISSSAYMSVLQTANKTKCVSNLRQIGIAAQLYISDHNNKTPVIEPWPADPVYSASDGAQTISEALGPYGVTSEVLQCPADVHGTTNYYAKEGSSYQWFPMANGQNAQAINLSSLFLAFDYSAVHNNCSNVLFGDGHVSTSN
jgi:prepilin-type N-terminal cleavage/methylation domain-containing protein/prepilin-type processing-associated H-X9-DG protein